MNKKLNVLITGGGGDIGQSIGKILKSRSDIFSKVIATDLHQEHAGKFIFDVCYTLPRCDSKEYKLKINKLVDKYQIDLIIPVSEYELRIIEKNYSKNNYFTKPYIIANWQSLNIGFDKKLTADFLRMNNLPFPKTELILDYKENNYPVIIKSKDGSGSKSLYIVKNAEELNLFKKVYPNFIVQEYLPNDNEEYTCGLYRSNSGEIREIILKRKLMGGFSGYGKRVDNKAIKKLLNDLALLLDLRGSINVQLRMVDNSPVIFEINPRFSSTVLFRHMMGFEDVIWSIQDKFNWDLDTYQINNTITKFYKGFKEYVD